VLYEMLVGDPPFTGSTAQAIVAKVVTEKPAPPSRLRDTIPPAVEDAVLTALEKLPADRFATAAEFAAALAGGSTLRSLNRTAARPDGRHRERQRGLIVAVITLAVFCVAGGWLLGRRGGGSSSGPTTYDASLPDSALVSFSASTRTVSYGTALRNMSAAPSGEFVVYAAKRGDSTALWYRSLRTVDLHPIPGTEGATAPRVSPDGSQIAFLLGDQIMVVPVSGGDGPIARIGRRRQPPQLSRSRRRHTAIEDHHALRRRRNVGGVTQATALLRQPHRVIRRP
jgi:serine/threonine-protein kinase